MRKVMIFILTLALFLNLPINSYAEEKKTELIIIGANEVIDGDYLKASDSIRISGTINGDAYVAAGSVDVDGNINGDLLAAGGNLLISGTVKNDIRVAGGNITLSGAKVGGNITVLGGQILIDKSTNISGSIVGAGGNLSILGPVGRGITIGGGQVTLGGRIGGNVLAGAGTLTLLNDSSIKGNLTYYSEEGAVISDSATVSGTIKQEIIPTPSPKPEIKKSSAFGLLGILLLFKFTDLFMLLAIGLLTILLVPNYVKLTTEYIKSNPLMSLVIGFAALVLAPILVIFILLTVVGIPFGLFLLIFYFAALWFARIFGIMTIGSIVSEKLDKGIGPKWSFVIGIIIYSIIGLLPVISFFADMLVLLTGFGSMLRSKKYLYTQLRTKNII